MKKLENKVALVTSGTRGIGLQCVKTLAENGATVYIAARRLDAANEICEELSKLNYKVKSVYFDATKEDSMAKMLTKTNGGFDKVIECCGSAPAVSEALMAVEPGGTVVLVGVSATPITIPTVIGVMRELKLLGAIAYTPEEFDTCLKLIAQKKINVTKYIDDLVPLEAVQESFERLTSGKDSAVKIVIKP